MPAYKAILIDDEKLALMRMEKLLSAFQDDIEIIAKASNGVDAIRMIDQLKPDVIFLDIQMPELSGFEVLEKISHQPFVIFSTAYDEYALKAFETNSIDYLLKPVDSARLHKAVEKLKTIKSESMHHFQSQLSNMLSGMKSPAKRIQVKKGDRIKLLAPENIYFFTADEKYTRVCTYDESFLIDASLSALEKELDENFVRVHRKNLVNLNHIEEINRMFKGSYKVKMKDKQMSELPVSRQYKYKLNL